MANKWARAHADIAEKKIVRRVDFVPASKSTTGLCIQHHSVPKTNLSAPMNKKKKHHEDIGLFDAALVNANSSWKEVKGC